MCGIGDQRSGIRDLKGGIWDTVPGPGITSHGIGVSSLLRDQGSSCTTLVGSGSEIFQAFGIKDQKFGYKFKGGINDENPYLVTTLSLSCFIFYYFRQVIVRHCRVLHIKEYTKPRYI